MMWWVKGHLARRNEGKVTESLVQVVRRPTCRRCPASGPWMHSLGSRRGKCTRRTKGLTMKADQPEEAESRRRAMRQIETMWDEVYGGRSTRLPGRRARGGNVREIPVSGNFRCARC